MGRSDGIVFPWYAERMRSVAGQRILFLAQPGHNSLSHSLGPSASHFFDLSLGNWDINQEADWPSPEVDAVICTRGAYFSERPLDFVERCLRSVRPGGIVFIDWGLGDHWRFKKFRVGWRDQEEHEYSTVGDRRCHLQSAAWNSCLEDHPQVAAFREWIKPFGYEGKLGPHVLKEVPSVLGIPSSSVVDCLAIWPEMPQLYILTAFQRT